MIAKRLLISTPRSRKTVNIDSLNKPYAGRLGHGRVDLLKAVSH